MMFRTIGVACFVTMLCSGAASAQPMPDALLSTPATPENVARGLEVDAYQLTVSAYLWGYPLVRMEQVMRDNTDVPNPKPSSSYRAPLNQIGWARDLASPAAKDMPTANNDTTYLSAVVDLTEPYVLSVPDVGKRYYVVDTFDMWQELEHYIGTRTTGTKAGKYVLVPPGWQGTLPPELTRLDISTNIVWLWGRMRVSPTDNLDQIHHLQDAFDLRPLSALGKQDWHAPAASLPPLPDIAGNPDGFFVLLASALKSNAIKPQDAALFGQFARIGLTKNGFDASNLSAPQKKGMARGLTDAPYAAIASIPATSEERQGWNYVRGLDDFGFNYALRAVVAGPYIGGQGEKEAVYPIRYTDSTGKKLSGANSYVLKFPSAPPSDAFWSLTIYDAGTKMMIENPIDRFKVGSDTPGLKTNADGSFSITVAATDPKTNTNWLPAPKGDFYLILRIYQPQQSVISGEWKLPQVVKAN